jgi:hypothetical protein
VTRQLQSATRWERRGIPGHENSSLPDYSDRMPAPYSFLHARAGYGSIRWVGGAERRGMRGNTSTMDQPNELAGSLWGSETDTEVGEHCRLEADCGWGEIFAAEPSARGGNLFPAVLAGAGPGAAVLKVEWSRDVSWSNKIAASQSR